MFYTECITYLCLRRNIILEPLAIAIVWNKEDQEFVKDYVEYTADMLSSDVNNPFSRTINLPIFYYTNIISDGVPPKVELEAEKLVIYIFISKNCFACEKWSTYIDEMYLLRNAIIVPIALDEASYNISDKIAPHNFIRAFDFKEHKKQQLFIWMAHEIYRYGFNEKKEVSSENSLKIFLSHAKDGCHGLNLAKELKCVIDNSSMQRFFDADDIAPGYRFDDEIVNNIRRSSIIIINSDIYSTRYWCQREIQVSKEYERPIIEVDLIVKGMDRKFPYAGNVPVVRADLVNGKVEAEDLYRILEIILLETIRCNYVNIKLSSLENGVIGRIKKMCRPPEMIDLQKIIKKDNQGIELVYDSVIYPDPPIYSEEINFYSKLGIKTYTPIEYGRDTILNKKIGISISDTENDELQKYGLNNGHLERLSKTIANYILGRGGTLIYGGDLRKNGYTEQLLLEAKVLKDRLKSDSIHLINYISWPIYLNDTSEVLDWKAKFRSLLEMKEIGIDEKAKELISESTKFIPPDSTVNCYAWAKSLTKMRYDMIKECDARICAGGRKFEYKGKIPGVLEEILIASELKRPIYLLGGFGGIVQTACKIIQGEADVECLSEQWQISHNDGYELLLKMYEENGEKIDYFTIVERLKNINLNNGLTEEENRKLFSTVYVDEAVHLILKGLQSI